MVSNRVCNNINNNINNPNNNNQNSIQGVVFRQLHPHLINFKPMDILHKYCF